MDGTDAREARTMIVALQGGLANQLFQYAFGRSVSIAKGEELFFKNQFGGAPHCKYGLDDLHTKIQFGGPHPTYLYSEGAFKYDTNVYNAPHGTFYNGFWQTEKYFNEPIVREEIRMKTPMSPEGMKWAEKIASAETSCSVHIRRGDYLKEPHKSFHGVLDLEYYRRALECVEHQMQYLGRVEFFIFSDDLNWCQNTFKGGFEFVDHGNAYESLFLMKLCHHAIIANSSYSWWGAWLGDEQKEDRLVIAPEKWFSDSSGMQYGDVVPERWVKIPNA